ncbi:hypothetical protein QCA50_006376 [Cerrena zonata]|uniref:RNase H type-1 domain-containing protein n=1 Tax=Cerrena zonata TaxID=2478898 RepID=A0AAW0GBA5_9APHY
MKRRHTANEVVRRENEAVIFDPSAKLKGTISKIFHIFSDTEVSTQEPGIRHCQGISMRNEALTVYISGGYSNKKRDMPRSSCCAWFEEDHPLNTTKRINVNSRPAADIAATLIAVQKALNFALIHVVTTSAYVTGTFTQYCTKWESRGWTDTKNEALVRATLARLRQRSAVTTFQWVKKEDATPENKKPATQARDTLTEQEIEDLDLSIPDPFNLTGMELATATQALVGKFWSKLPGYEDRGICPKCKTTEDMEHILFQCTAPGQKLVWRLAQILWSRSKWKWHGRNLGLLLGSALIPFPPPPNTASENSELQEANWQLRRKKMKRKKSNDKLSKNGAQRLYIILLSKSAYFIWKLRNECRIKHGSDPEFTHPDTEIENRWYNTIDTCLSMDRAMVNPAKFGKLAIDPNLVLKTWNGVLHNEDRLPDNWIRTPGVLVGRGYPETGGKSRHR